MYLDLFSALLNSQEVETSVQFTIEVYLHLPLEEYECYRFLIFNEIAPLTSSHQVVADVRAVCITQ